MQNQYSLRSPAVKRLMREAQELQEATETYHAQPLEDNLFEWHFTIRGPEDSEFDGGIYHGRIILPPDYPMKPPSIILLTPNGRFETYKKICLSISGHHPESWQPSWSIRTALLAIIGFMPTHGNGAIGSLDYTPDERKVLARRSMEFKCQSCGPISCILKPVTEASKQSNIEAKQLAQQINFQGEKDKKSVSETKTTATSSVNPTDSTNRTSENIAGNPYPQVNMGSNPFGMMPPFMNPMFNPPTTTAQSGSSAIPPQMFMPPYWPPNMMPPQQGQNSNTNTPPFWTPGSYNYMMQSTSSASTLSSATTQNSSIVTSSPTVTTISSSDATSVSEPSTPQNTIQASGASTITTSSQQPVSTNTQERPNTSVTDTSAGLRQRTLSQARIQRTSQPADLPQGRPGSRSSGGGCTLWLMVIVGLALILLIIRRLIMMELLKFDISF